MLKASPARIFLGLLLGTALGYVILLSGSPLLHRVPAVVAPVGNLFINSIRLCVIPLVTSSLIVGCASSSDPGKIGRLAVRSLVVIGILLAIAAVFAGAIAFPAFRHLNVLIHGAARPAVSGAVRSSVGGAGEWVSDLIPANVFKAASDGALLPLILFSIGFGLAVSRLPENSRSLLQRFFEAIAQAFTLLIGAVLQAAPIGVFCLAVNLAASIGLRGAGALVAYIIVLSVVSAAYIILILYPGVALFSRVPLRPFMKAAAPAQALAFSSRSSLAALPATYAAGREQLGLREDVASFFFPFAASLFRVGGCMAQMVGVCFLAVFYNVPLSASQLALMVLNAIAISLTVPGIPGGAIIVMVPTLAALGIPTEGVAMLLAVDTLPDMFRTTANVTGWLAAAVVLPGSISETVEAK